MSSQRVHLFGIRHHGPGSARSLERALERLEPDCLLIEGPPDAEPILPLAAHVEMSPPVALLVYVPDAPRRAAFYPFARFSPEWRAILYGLGRQIAVRFIDLPQWHQLVEEESHSEAPETASSQPDDEASTPSREEPRWRFDPLGLLAEIAGFSDGERWWDHLVESRRYDGEDVFSEIRHAMTALRDGLPPRDDVREGQREAYMRKGIRAALKEGFERIAVVCGAWHVPALDPERFPPATRDNELLKGLKKVKTEAAWSPWTYDRLATASGYGAGVISPAWYELLWSDEKNVAIHWMTRVAQLMRDRDLDASSAHVIEAVRLSESLASLRDRPLPGLDELREAALSVVCGGQEAPMALIHRRLIIGQRLGAVPEDSPMAPLQRDLAALQRRLKLPASDGAKTYDFDLRKPTDLGRSQLLHRLNLLDVPWGEPVDAARGAKGTFHEHWRLQWQPEFAVRLIEASHFGSTIEVAASARTIAASQEAGNLRELTELLNDVLLAALPSAVEALVSAIQRRAATGSDVPQLMAALPALARSQRYGNVRQTDQELVASVVAGIIERICIGLPPATTSLNDEAATEMFGLVQGVHSSLQILESPDWFDDWLTSIGQVSNQESSHPLVRGRAVRILYDGGRLGPGELESHLTVATSPGLTRSATAAWFEGFLKDSGLILVHDAVLWNAINSWIGSLGTESFVEVLPLLRRTFATFQAPERRQIGELAKRGGATVASSSQSGQPFDFDRAARVVPLVMTLLGREVADG